MIYNGGHRVKGGISAGFGRSARNCPGPVIIIFNVHLESEFLSL